ncbi:MAG: tetratricopeptide repeat protein [Acetobacteraceae bacterium]|nr:tetratricopeptide repeat protein [Acetobacteraceae bacterium]
MRRARTLAGAGLLLLLATPLAAQSQPGTDALFAALKAAPSEDAAAAVEAQIRAQWDKSASPAVRLLLSRGARELSEGAPGDALDSFDAALDLSPDLLDAWRARARARRALGDWAGATRDLEELLKREPHSFVAFEDLSSLAESRGDWRGALAAWQKVLEISPHTPNGQTRLQDLRRRALGEEL